MKSCVAILVFMHYTQSCRSLAFPENPPSHTIFAQNIRFRNSIGTCAIARKRRTSPAKLASISPAGHREQRQPHYTHNGSSGILSPQARSHPQRAFANTHRKPAPIAPFRRLPCPSHNSLSSTTAPTMEQNTNRALPPRGGSSGTTILCKPARIRDGSSRISRRNARLAAAGHREAPQLSMTGFREYPAAWRTFPCRVIANGFGTSRIYHRAIEKESAGLR